MTKKYIKLIESRLTDPESFAKSFGAEHIHPWIIDQYKKGFNSHKDYEQIVKWVIDNNPNIDDLDFNTALRNANNYFDSKKKSNFDPYMEVHSGNVLIDFDNGNKWINIDNNDIDGVVNRLQFDCYGDLKDVDNCWALIDPQENFLCVAYCLSNKIGVIGKMGSYPNFHDEIKSLCVRKGFDLVPEAFNNSSLVGAIKIKQLNIDGVRDKRSVMSRLSPNDIIDCNLLSYAHYCPIKTIYELYKMTSHDCLLVYAFCYLICNNNMDSKAYKILKNEVNNNENVRSIFNHIDGSDSRAYSKVMEESISEIINLDNKM